MKVAGALRLDHRTGGIALIVGYGLFIAVLFRNPTAGLAAATASAQGVVFFLLLPITGLVSGAYVFLDTPFRTTVAFLTGSYLAVSGIAIALLPADDTAITALLGLVLVGLGTLALVATLRPAVRSPECGYLRRT
ncbi:MAG: hypothetical protein V5A39_06220 [Haloarculaceae archaeon]